MTLPLRALPIVEQWDCHCTGVCCRGTIINLTDDDLRRIRQQQWHKHPDYRGQRIITRRGLLRPKHFLAKRRDGSCIFLTEDGLCRIHRDLGEAAKPVVCRLFPFQLVPLENSALVTLRRYCPSAAQSQGRPVEEQLRTVRELAVAGGLAEKPAPAPTVTRGHRRPWADAHRVMDAIERLMLDERYPLVRRLAHAGHFMELLDRSRLQRIPGPEFASLLSMLESIAVGDEKIAGCFRDRRPVSRAGAMLFRQVALEHTRLHPKYVIRQSWRERARLVRAAMRFARGRGKMPFLHECFPPCTFESLEAPLGPLDAVLMRPLQDFFQAGAASRQYSLLCRSGWSLSEAFRALALSFAAAMWLLRLSSNGQPPALEPMLDAVAAIDRGQGFPPLCGPRHRYRVNSLSVLGDLPRLLAWYGR